MSALKNEKQLLKFEYDFARDGGAVSVIDLKENVTKLKAGMIITDTLVIVDSALVGGAGVEVTLGLTGDADALLVDFKAAAVADAVVRSPRGALKVAADEALVMGVSVATLTAGKLTVYLEVISE